MAEMRVVNHLGPEPGERDVTTAELGAWLLELGRDGDDGTAAVQVKTWLGWRRVRRVRAVSHRQAGLGVPAVQSPQDAQWAAEALPTGHQHHDDVVLPDYGADTAPVMLPASPRHAAGRGG